MCAQNSTYSLFIPGFVLCTNPFLFRIKIANELSEFRNYLILIITFYVKGLFTIYVSKHVWLFNTYKIQK